MQMNSILGGNQMQNRTKTIIILIGLLALGMIFNFADFSISRSQTTSEHRLATYRLGDDIPAPAPADQSRTLAVAGEGALVEKLRRALLAELNASNLFTNGEWVVEPNAGNNNLDLLVTIESSRTFWTPVYGQATLATSLVYASDGDVSWYGTTPVVMETDDGSPVLWADGDFELKDRCGGLLSKPAYQRLLAEKMAAEIVSTLASAYTQ
jgi:hypothetical protein